jgi:hypothetical protein
VAVVKRTHRLGFERARVQKGAGWVFERARVVEMGAGWVFEWGWFSKRAPVVYEWARLSRGARLVLETGAGGLQIGAVVE